MMADRGLRLALQALHHGRVDASAFQHGAVGPAGVMVPTQEEDRHLGPFALVEALFQFRHLAPGGRRQAADAEHVAMARLAVVAPLAQALLQLGDRQQLAAQAGRIQLQAAEDGVGVGVDETGHQYLAAQVDHTGVRFLEAEDVGVAAHGAHLAVLHRDGLLQGLAGFGGVDLGVMKDEVDRRHAFQGGTSQGDGQEGRSEGFHRVYSGSCWSDTEPTQAVRAAECYVSAQLLCRTGTDRWTSSARSPCSWPPPNAAASVAPPSNWARPLRP
ncbi:hypothetical protein FQZ97_818590 [compost metagenome]